MRRPPLSLLHGCTLVAVLLAALFGATEAPAAGRRALLVGSARGDVNEPLLRHTGNDVRRLRDVLVGLGRFSREDIDVLEEATAADVLAQLDRFAASRERPDTFLFFYTGHADASALHMGGTRLSLQTLHARLKAVPAGLRVAILDACQSGGVLRSKGLVRAPVFDVALQPSEASGLVILSSSSADEESFESDGAQGAVFTLHLTSGLRGAADGDGNAQVTLAEAARYAYAQTVRSTLHVSSGPQHPMFKWDVVGRQDPVLAWIDSSASLTFAGERDREYIIFDGAERSVLAEIIAPAKTQPRVALAPGTYVVRQRSETASRVARLALGRGDHRILHEHQMRETPLVALAQKGQLGQRWVYGAAGLWAFEGWHGGVTNGVFTLRVDAGVEWERPRWTFGAGFAFTQWSRGENGLQVKDLMLGPNVYALWTARWETLTLRTGPVMGLALMRQDVTGDDARYGLLPGVGLRLRADLSINPRLAVFAALTPQWVVGRYEPSSFGWGNDLGLGWKGFQTAELTFGTRVSW